jgi:flagellar basal body-associated protein FliL
VIALVAVLATLLLVAIVMLAAAVVVLSRRELSRKADDQVAEALQDRLMNGLYVERVVVTLRTAETFTRTACRHRRKVAAVAGNRGTRR